MPEPGVGMRRGICVVAAIGLCACGISQPPQPRQSEAMERSARMLKALSQLEADLHDVDATVDTYAELVERHGQAQQMACAVTNDHVQEIHRLAVAQERKREEKARKHRQIAMARRGATNRAVASR